jgi:hypothetical protein
MRERELLSGGVRLKPTFGGCLGGIRAEVFEEKDVSAAQSLAAQGL